MLYHRYADPASLLGGMIAAGRLPEFIQAMYRQADEERLWELYLSELIKEQSFVQWKEMLMRPPEKKGRGMTREEVEATVRESEEILSGFVP